MGVPVPCVAFLLEVHIGRRKPVIFMFQEVKGMSEQAILGSATLMANGQVTIPKAVLEVLGVECGNYVAFIVEGGTVRIVNAAVYALQKFQEEMAGEAERTGLTSDADVAALVEELRQENQNT